MHNRLALFVIVICTGIVGRSDGQTAAPASQTPRLHTSITGSVKNSSGLQDPQYVLSFPSIQELMLEASQHAVRADAIDKALKPSPVKLDDLLNLGLLRKENESYRLNYLLLTVSDQHNMYDAARRYGRSLADAFQSRRSEFNDIFRQYPKEAFRPQLMFGLVAGAALNWEGLRLTTELGYRAHPVRHANGDVYLVHSRETGAKLDSTGLYLDSETAPGKTMTFTTFGDDSPRVEGIPDVFEGLENAVDGWKQKPEIYAALRSEYVTLMLEAIDDAGRVMNAIASGAHSRADISKAVPIPDARRDAVLRLLTSLGYLTNSNDWYEFGVPVLTSADRPLVEATLKLSRSVMTEWLATNYPHMKKELSDLSPMRSGLPFELVFSEVWHYEFGFATKMLAEAGFYVNPHQPGSRYPGYVPLVWQNSLLTTPGN